MPRQMIDRLVLAARRRSRRRERERALRALPGYFPAVSGGHSVPRLRRGSVAVTVAATVALTAPAAVGYAVASEVHDRGSEARYEQADREFERAWAAYSAARAVELERADTEPPETPVEALEVYSSPETDTARELQGDMSAAAAAWRSAADET